MVENKKIAERKIVLGPLLGYENNGIYTICFLTDFKNDNFSCHVKINGKHKIFETFDVTHIESHHHFFYRFEIELRDWNDCEVEYYIQLSDAFLATRHATFNWSFKIPARNSQPEIAFISCSGMHSKYPTDIKPKYFLGWQQLLNHKPHFMILSGDQVYADSIFKKIKCLEPFMTSKCEDPKDFGIDEHEMDKFYFQLYIDSWSNVHMATALAEIPNIMTWDDHDIIDGYGSYQKKFFKKVKIFYEPASKYFQLFQIRTLKNQSLIDKSSTKKRKDYSQIVILGNNLFVIPDTRSFRDWKQVLSSKQYNKINYHLESLKNKGLMLDVVAFVLPVPIAHRDFTSNFEKFATKFTDKLLGFNLLSDDLIDHWDHEFHKPEQKIMMDFIFNWGEYFKSKHLLIVSGDVHSSGVATITQTSSYNEKRFATQVVSSPMVNSTAPIRKMINDYISNDFKVFDNYACHLYNFGSFLMKDIYSRNFIILKKPNNTLKLFLHRETKIGWTDKHEKVETIRTVNNRTLNKRGLFQP